MAQIRLVKVCKTYKSNEDSVFNMSNINLTIKGPQLVIILGVSGSGKSTLLNIISGIEKSDSGEIFYDEINKSEIGMVFQDYKLFQEHDVMFNVTLPLLIKGISLQKAHQTANYWLSYFSIEQLKKKKIKLLSGGEKQRVAICRALINDSKVLLADEPTGALDHNNSISVFDMLKKISRTKLVIVVTHNEQLAFKYADRLIRMRDGKIESDNNSCSNTLLIEDNKILNTKSKISFPFWLFSIVANRMRKTVRKMGLLISVIAFCMIFIMVSLTFVNEAQEHILEGMNSYGDYGVFNITKVETIKGDNALFDLKRMERPQLYEINEIKQRISSLRVFYSLGAIIDEYININDNDEVILNVRFAPIFDAIGDSVEHVIINDKLNKMLDKNPQLSANFKEKTSQTFGVYDVFSLTLNLQIESVVNEFGLLNTPTIYYNYRLMQELLISKMCVNHTKLFGRPYSWFDVICHAKNTEPLSNYALTVVIKDEDVNDFAMLFNSKTVDYLVPHYEISSFSLAIKDSLTTVLALVQTAIIIFIGLAILGTCLILIMSTYINAFENRKESAIIKSLGGKESEILGTFVLYNSTLFFIAYLIANLSNLFLTRFINNIIYKYFSIANFLSINFNLKILVALLGFSSIILISCMAVYISKKNGLAAELKAL